MKEYKIIKPQGLFNLKDKNFEELFNKYAANGWRIISVAYSQVGQIQKAVIERDKNR